MNRTKALANRGRAACVARLHTLVLALGASVLLAGNAAATVVPGVGFDRMISDAELIVRGTVADVEARWSRDQTTIHTYVTFDRLSVVHGKVPGDKLTLRFEGGEIDQYRIEVDGVPAFEIGQEEILFVRGNGVSASPIVGFFQGRFKVVDGAIHDYAGAPIVRVSEGSLVKLMDDVRAAADPGVSAGTPEDTLTRYEKHLEHDRAEAAMIAHRSRRGQTIDRYPEQGPGKGTGADDAGTRDQDVVAPPTAVEAGVAIQPAGKPVATYLPRSADTGERLLVDGFVDHIRSRLGK